MAAAMQLITSVLIIVVFTVHNLLKLISFTSDVFTHASDRDALIY